MLNYVLHSVQGFYVKLCITLCALGLYVKLCITLCVLGSMLNYVLHSVS